VLGLIWKPEDDVFTFKVLLNFTEKGKQMDNIFSFSSCDVSHCDIALTKRIVLKQVAGVYDPLGIVIPYILTAKVLMRSLCQENQSSSENWDKPLSSEMKQHCIEFSRVSLNLNFLKYQGVFDQKLCTENRC
jgi:hypothetical protein